MKVSAAYDSLPEASLRYLRRIARLMTDGSTAEVVLTLQDGGVRDYRETNRLRPTDLDESDDGLVSKLG